MSDLCILIVEDETPVREALLADLTEFSQYIQLESCEDVAEAWEVVEDVLAEGVSLALVLSDHRLPGTSGVDFLIQLGQREETAWAGKVLVTGQADLADTVRAVNEAGLDHYIAKPWDPQDLHTVVSEQLTEYILAAGIDPLPYLPILDKVRVMEAIADAN